MFKQCVHFISVHKEEGMSAKELNVCNEKHKPTPPQTKNKLITYKNNKN